MNEIVNQEKARLHKIDRMRELVFQINKASEAYYNEDREIMDNKAYDKLYDELVSLEKETGCVLGDSPTHTVGCEVVGGLERVQHPSPMLSLDKTKDVRDLEKFLGTREGILSWKLDGLTVVVTYRNGKLERAVTRGDGHVGEDITHNARVFANLPREIPFKGELVVRGEAVISYSDFDRINEGIGDADAKYKNPRNLCSGTIRQLDASVAADRHVRLICFELVSAEGVRFEYVSDAFSWLMIEGFEVVPYAYTDAYYVGAAVKNFEEAIQSYPFPSDGLVLRFNDIAYGDSLGTTSKFPNHSIAFKWQDETEITKLIDVEWNTSRTGLVNPVAVFEPVELEGTTVSRATLHNVSVVESLELGIGDEISVYKANKIIPAIEDNFTRSGTLRLPERCPSCGEPLHIQKQNESKVLMCRNLWCPAQSVSKIIHFASRGCMDIKGLGEAAVSLLAQKGILTSIKDVYGLKDKRNILLTLPLWKEKKVDGLLDEIEKSKHCKLEKYIAALGIPGVGASQAKVLASVFKDWSAFEDAIRSGDRLMQIDGFGETTVLSIQKWYKGVYQKEHLEELTALMDFEKQEAKGSLSMDGLTFVITGSLKHFKNREELKAYIEDHGGKVAGSVTAKTSYLINNDAESTSGKNKKARELGIEILPEVDLLKKF